jgi:hypothetical protein
MWLRASGGTEFFILGARLLQPTAAMMQITAGAAIAVPIVILISEAWDQVFLHHLGALAKVGHVLAGVPAGFGDEVSKVLHYLDAYRLPAFGVFPLCSLLYGWIKILSVTAKT